MTSPNEKAQVLSFSNSIPEWVVEPNSTQDPTVNNDLHVGEADLGTFLSRPVKIYSTNVTPADNSFVTLVTLNPWELFFSDPAIQAKIDHFRFIRCNLRLKIKINGSPFHYGRYIASYEPNSGQLCKDWTQGINTMVQLSQLPHILLNPTKSLGGEMLLPFVHPRSAIRVDNINDFSRMGTLRIVPMTPLSNLTGASELITISVMAWAEDVQLTIPTAATSFTPQSKKITVKRGGDDEYGEGVISKPANVIAAMANRLTDVPLIAPFAMATQIGAGAVSNIAKIFGFSKPAVLTPIQYYRNLPFGEMANTIGSTPAVRITLDPKQELSVDPRTVGVGPEDQMSIKSIVTRESFLDSFTWGDDITPDNHLWGTRVAPTMAFRFNNAGAGNLPSYHTTAACYGALPFRAWRGTMKYKFEVVATDKHRGALRISYDPRSNLGMTNPEDTYTTNFSEIIDISKHQEFTVEIPWCQNQPYCISRTMDGAVSTLYGTAPVSSTYGQDNGVLMVSVFNTLSTPFTDNDVKILVSVSMCEDAEFRQPTDDHIWRFGQKFEAPAAAKSSSKIEDNVAYFTTDKKDVIRLEPQSETTVQLLHVDDSSDGLNEAVFYGDPIKSFRNLLKRETYTHSMTNPSFTNPETMSLWVVRLPIEPPFRGYSDALSTQRDNGQSFNYCKTTLFNFLRPAYFGFRGSQRWKICDSSRDHIGSFKAELVVASDFKNEMTEVKGQLTTPSQFASLMKENNHSGISGLALTQSQTQNGLCVEYPFYYPYRFAYAGDESESGQTWNNIVPNTQQLTANIGTGNWTHFENSLDFYHSVGEDFTFFWFLCTPVLVQLTDPTPL